MGMLVEERLAGMDDLRALARNAGFREVAWEDATSDVRAKASGR